MCGHADARRPGRYPPVSRAASQFSDGRLPVGEEGVAAGVVAELRRNDFHERGVGCAQRVEDVGALGVDVRIEMVCR